MRLTQTTMNPLVQDYLTDKYFKEDEELKSLQTQADETQKSANMMKGFETIGAALSGRKADTAFYDDLAKQGRQKITDLSDQRKMQMENVSRDKLKEQLDPDSTVSKQIRDAYKRLAPDVVGKIENFDSLSGYDIQQNLAKPLELYQKAEERSLQREEQRTLRQLARQDKEFERARKVEREDKERAEKDQALMTPLGMANTPDDAKQLKEAFEAKRTFDSKLREMIALRKKHEGGALFSPQDRERGAQLASEALLQMKTMEKLGVLSKSDEDIINRIIPQDPLELRGVVETFQGTDSVLNRLESKLADADRDFKSRLDSRIRKGTRVSDEEYASLFQTESPNDMVAVSNGTEYLEIPRRDLQDAEADGFKLLGNVPNTARK